MKKFLFFSLMMRMLSKRVLVLISILLFLLLLPLVYAGYCENAPHYPSLKEAKGRGTCCRNDIGCVGYACAMSGGYAFCADLDSDGWADDCAHGECNNIGSCQPCEKHDSCPDKGMQKILDDPDCRRSLPIYGCTDIVEPGVYYLNNDILDYDGPRYICINIKANDVILDCQGKTINGTRWIRTEPTTTYASYGIILESVNRAKIKNCSVNNWCYGINVISGSHNTIENNTISSCEREGILVEASSYNTIENNTIYSNQCGVKVTHTGQLGYGTALGSTYNTIENNTIYSNREYGIYICGVINEQNTIKRNEIDSNHIGIKLTGERNEIVSNRIENSNNAGIDLPGGATYYTSRDNIIYNNLFNNTKNVDIYGTAPGWVKNYWNTTKQEGENILGKGKYIGGNYWTNPSHTEFSDKCSDEKDCICNEPYKLDENNVDYLPLTLWCDCLDKCCHTDKKTLLKKDSGGTYTCKGAYGFCKYSVEKECPTDAKDSDNSPPPEARYFSSTINNDLKVKGSCIKYTGCANGECTSDYPVWDKCTEACLSSEDKTRIGKADINGDGTINILDIAIVAKAYGSYPGHPNWNSKADLDGNDVINILDIAKVAKEYGKDFTQPCYLIEYYASGGSCVEEKVNCSQIFGFGWGCYQDRCANCTELGCPAWRIDFTGCRDICNKKGFNISYTCNKVTGGCDESKTDYYEPVSSNTTCVNGGEVKANSTYNCGVVYKCKEGDCSGYLRYVACDGKGYCDDKAEKYFAAKEVFAPSGYVLTSDCGKKEGYCGKCGTCSNGICAGEGCPPGSTQACGDCGTQTCGSNCQWGACEGEGCHPWSTEACGRCSSGTQTCGSNCQWGQCLGETGCEPGSTGDSCSKGRCCTGTYKCNNNCQWECDSHPDSSLCDIGCRSDCTCETG